VGRKRRARDEARLASGKRCIVGTELMVRQIYPEFSRRETARKKLSLWRVKVHAGTLKKEELEVILPSKGNTYI
jgi:hypothetical protein